MTVGGVPIAVRVGSTHITREVAAVSWRKEAIGGMKSITFRLFRPLSAFDPDLDPFSEVQISDTRSAVQIGTARLSDTGRSASGAGQAWEIVGFAPWVHTTDRREPYIVVDQSPERWVPSQYSTKGARLETSDVDDDTPCLQATAPADTDVTTSGNVTYQTSLVTNARWTGDFIYRAIREAGQQLGRVRCKIRAGVTDANFTNGILTRTGSGGGSYVASATASTTAATFAAKYGDASFGATDDIANLRVSRHNSDTTGVEEHVFQFYEIVVRALLKDAAGADITTGYTSSAVLAHQVVNDLLGRFLTDYDGAAAVVSTNGTYPIDQLAYPEGVTPEEVLNDLLALESAFCWWLDANGVFHWEPLPTTVRYEVTLDDAGDFPLSSQDVWNEVTVRYRTASGRTRTRRRTLACDFLDNRPGGRLVRSTVIDLADEVGSAAAADRAGDEFLEDHNLPKNAGTLNVSRRIRDVITGADVDPQDIEPRELIRVRGVESYPDALNADSNDGQTVFRIWALDYSTEDGTARLELDTDTRTITSALKQLLTKRTRKR